MTAEAAYDEVHVALGVCRTLGMPPDRVRRCIGPYRSAFLETCTHPERLNEHDMRVVARWLRQAAAIFRLEQDCLAGRHVTALTRYGG